VGGKGKNLIADGYSRRKRKIAAKETDVSSSQKGLRHVKKEPRFAWVVRSGRGSESACMERRERSPGGGGGVWGVWGVGGGGGGGGFGGGVLRTALE